MKSGLRILIRAPEVPFLVPPKLQKQPLKISPCPIGHIKGNFGQSGPYVKVEANALKLFLTDKDI